MNPWIALVGTRDEGRVGTALELLDALRAAGLRIGGFVQEKVMRGDEIAGYDLVDLAKGRVIALARPSSTPRICSWGFDPTAFERAAEWALSEADVSVIEVGRIEAAGEGHFPALLSALRASPRVVLVCVRPTVLASIALALPDPEDFLELPAMAQERASFVRRCVELARSIGPRAQRCEPRSVGESRYSQEREGSTPPRLSVASPCADGCGE